MKEIEKILRKNFFYKGVNYKRSGLTLHQSIKSTKRAFDKAQKCGIDRITLEKEFQKGFESK